MSKIENNAPLIIGDGLDKKRLSRRFLGYFPPNNCYENKELKAYLSGQTHFFYKRDELGWPKRYEVRQEYFYQ